jgi:hypothetical protein
VQTTPDEAALFREECLYWQHELGLLDWTLHFKTAPDGKDDTQALVTYDCDSRHAIMTYYMGVEQALHPRDVACHEVLHLLFADMLHSPQTKAAQAREEHKAIERLLKVLPRKRRK